MKLMAKVLCIVVLLMVASQAMAYDDQDYVVNEIRTHVQLRQLKYDSKRGLIDVQIIEYKYSRRIVLKDLLYIPKPDTAPETALETAPESRGEAAHQPSDLDALIAEARTLLAHRDSPEPDTFEDPLAFIRNDHARQMRMCNLLDAFTEKLEVEPVKPLASALLEYLTGDLPLHTQDEERDLRPALEERCEPEDGLDEVLKQMTKSTSSTAIWSAS